jgi:hypothetical protein
MTKKIILAGPSNLIKASLTQVMALRQLTEDIEELVQNVHGSVQGNKQPVTKRKKHPKVTLFFSEDKYEAVVNDRSPIVGEIGFRLMRETRSTFNPEKAKALANKIKLKFGGETPFRWVKGKQMFSYSDWDKGYQLQLLCANKTEAKRIVEQILDLQSHSPDWTKFNGTYNELPEQRYPETTQREYIYGENVEIDNSRPFVTVHFRYAFVSINGIKHPIDLVDTTGKRNNPLVV